MKVRMIYKVIDKSNGKYYIGKGIYDGLDGIKNYFKYMNTNEKFSKGGLSDYVYHCDFNDLEFEILEYDIQHISMEEVLEKYLSKETDYNKLIYHNQQVFVKNNNLKGDKIKIGDIIKIKDGFIGKVVDVDDLVLVNVDGLPYFIELEYCELINK